MIKIKYYPVRFQKDCQEWEFNFSRSLLLKDYINKIGIEYKDLEVIVDGKVVSDFDIVLDDQSEIIVTPKIRWGAIGAAIYVWWMSLGVVGAILTVASIALTAYSVYQAIMAARQPGFGSSGEGLDANSPTYGWDGIRTVQEVGIPVKVLYGEHRTGGNIINQFISTDGDKQYLNMLIAVGEGEIESIDDILVNDNPIENFSDIVVEKRYGTNDQTIIQNFGDLHNIYNIGSQLVQSAPYVYTTNDVDVEAFEIYLTLPSGLFQVSGSDILAWSVSYQVDYKLHSDSVYSELPIETITERSRSTVRRVFRKEGLVAGQYDIRITRTSADSQLSPQMTGDLYLTSIDEIQTGDIAYPNTALLSIKALATNQLSGTTPNVTFVVKGIKVLQPKIMNGAVEVDWEDYYWDPVTEEWKLIEDDTVCTWDGTSWVTKYSANPIWCLRDLLLNTRYGLGEYLEAENIDEDELLEMAKYCEERVSYIAAITTYLTEVSITNAIQDISPYCVTARSGDLINYHKNLFVNSKGWLYFGYISSTADPLGYSENQRFSLSISDNLGRSWIQRVKTDVFNEYVEQNNDMFQIPWEILSNDYPYFFMPSRSIVGGPAIIFSGTKDITNCSDWNANEELNVPEKNTIFASAVDSNDVVHIVYSSGSIYVYHVTFSNGVWGTPELVATSTQYFGQSTLVDLFIDSSNNLHVLYNSDEGYGGAHCNYICYSEGSWSSPAVVFDEPYYYRSMERLNVIVDSFGNVHFSALFVYWNNSPYTIQIRYRTKTEAVWSDVELILDSTYNVVGTQINPILGMDASGSIYLSWSQKNVGTYPTKHQLLYKKRNPDLGNWEDIVYVTDTDLDHFNVAQLGNKVHPSRNIPTLGCAGVYSTSVSWYGYGWGTNPPIIHYWKSTDLVHSVTPTNLFRCDSSEVSNKTTYEKRFRMDVVMDSYTKAPDVITQLTAAFRAFCFYSQNGYSFKIDKPVTLPDEAVQVFGMGNILKGQFNQAWKSVGDTANLIEVQYADKDTNYENEIVSVVDSETVDAGDPIRKKSLRLFLTRKSYALREARYALLVNKYIQRSMTIRCGIDAVACKAGDIVYVSHDVPQWGYSGKVKAGSTGTLVKLDREVEIEEGKTYRIMVKFSDNSIAEKTVTDPIGTYTEVHTSESFDQTPTAYDVYAFGEITKVVKPFRVMTLGRQGDGEVDISLIEYDANVYTEEAEEVPVNNYSDITFAIENVTDLVVTKNEADSSIDVWFDKPLVDGSFYTIKNVRIYLYTSEDPAWIVIGETTGKSFNIPVSVVNGVAYTVKVVTVTDTGKEGDFGNSPTAVLYTPAESPSSSPSVSPSKSPSVSPSPSYSPSISTSVSPSVSPSKSPSISASVSPSVSPSPSVPG